MLLLIFYQILLIILLPLVKLLNFFSTKVHFFLKKQIEDRKKIEKFEFINPQKKIIWFHSSSVGELDQSRAIIRKIKESDKGIFILQSVYSASVSDKQLDDTLFDLTFHLPMDHYYAYDFIFKKFNINLIVFVAWDVWPNLVFRSHHLGIPTILVCGVFKKSNYFLMNSFKQKIWNKLSAIYTAHEDFKTQITTNLTLNKTLIQNLGDSRADEIHYKIQKNLEANQQFHEISKSRKIILLASTYPICENYFLPIFSDHVFDNYDFWIFPHKIDSDRIFSLETLLKKNNIPYKLFSKHSEINSRIVIFDVLGQLIYRYREAFLAYVGGALHHRVHNILEPAYWGLPILTGFKIYNSSDALELKKQNCLHTFRHQDEIKLKLLYLIENHDKIKEKTLKYFQKGLGSSDRIFQGLKKFIK